MFSTTLPCAPCTGCGVTRAASARARNKVQQDRRRSRPQRSLKLNCRARSDLADWIGQRRSPKVLQEGWILDGLRSRRGTRLAHEGDRSDVAGAQPDSQREFLKRQTLSKALASSYPRKCIQTRPEFISGGKRKLKLSKGFDALEILADCRVVHQPRRSGQIGRASCRERV